MSKSTRPRLTVWERFLVFTCKPLVAFLHLIRPIVWIRFGWLHTHKIGHILLEPEHYLCERMAGVQPRRSVDLFFDRERGDGKVCNEFAMMMVKRNISVHPWVKYLWKANRQLRNSEAHIVAIKAREEYAIRDRDGLFERYPVQVGFTAEEQARGRTLLAELGVPSTGRYVCLHVRDALYWKSRVPQIGSDSDFRNSDIRDFTDAVEALIEHGFYVVQMGHPSNESIKCADPRYIDYPRLGRSDFMDVYLAAHCHLMVSTGSGIDSIAYMWRRPILMCNIAPLSRVFSEKSTIVNLPKLYRRKGANDFMSFADAIASGAGEFFTTQDFEKAGIEVQGSPRELIRDAAIEMLARLDGTWEETGADRARQQRFWSIFASDHFHREVHGAISSCYLRKYEALL